MQGADLRGKESRTQMEEAKVKSWKLTDCGIVDLTPQAAWHITGTWKY